jgi:serine/threonine-protein kinase
MANELAPGSQLGGYRIIERIGRGGMGAVYSAHDEGLGREVAIKVLAAEVAKDPAAILRFRREAETLARVRHPNVAVVHLAQADGEVPFLVLEYLQGGTLAERIHAQGRLGWREAAAIGAKLARGLAAVHDAGLVHRDVKPSNVLFDADGEPKLSDFGLARAARSTGGSLTATGEIVGTLEFLSPEQGRGADRHVAAALLG